MLPRERVIAALEHRESDRIPWGEHSINYNVYEDILGRPSFVQGQFKETRALWDGRRDEADLRFLLPRRRLRCFAHRLRRRLLLSESRR